MNRFRNFIALAIFSLLVLALPNVASAQYNNRNNRNDDGYYGNGNNNNRNSNRNLQSTIKNLKNHSREFERRLDRELDHSRYDGTNREDRLLQIAKDFQNATESLDNSYDNRRDYNKSQDEARRVLQLGSQLDRAVSRSRVSNNVGSDLNRIRQDLSVLANAYNYNNNNRNGGYNRNGGNGRNGDDGYYDNDDDYNRNNRTNQNNRNNRRNTNNNGNWRNAIPFPLPF